MTGLLLMPAEGGGFDPFAFAGGATFWTWVSFLLALPLMWKFVFGPITRSMAERDQKVEDSIRAAEEARRKAEEQIAAARAEAEKARADAKRQIDEALARASTQAQATLREAKTEAERQLVKARESIDAERRKALLEIRKEVVDLTIRSASRVLKRSVDGEANRKLVQDFLSGAGSH